MLKILIFRGLSFWGCPKDNPRINEILCEHSIRTYSFISGDVYFLRTDTTLHRTAPLSSDGRRVMLNMTWSSKKDLDKKFDKDDKRWDNPDVNEAKNISEK